MLSSGYSWPIFVEDRRDRTIYITSERWEHALGHPGMSDALLVATLETIREGSHRQDTYDATKFYYTREYYDLPDPYTHMVVVVKAGWQGIPPVPNNFVLTAYLIQKW